jgi:hypothetical protein
VGIVSICLPGRRFLSEAYFTIDLAVRDIFPVSHVGINLCLLRSITRIRETVGCNRLAQIASVGPSHYDCHRYDIKNWSIQLFQIYPYLRSVAKVVLPEDASGR